MLFAIYARKSVQRTQRLTSNMGKDERERREKREKMLASRISRI